MKRIYIFLLCFAVLLPVGGKTAQAKEQAGEQYLLLEHVKDKISVEPEIFYVDKGHIKGE